MYVVILRVIDIFGNYYNTLVAIVQERKCSLQYGRSFVALSSVPKKVSHGLFLELFLHAPLVKDVTTTVVTRSICR